MGDAIRKARMTAIQRELETVPRCHGFENAADTSVTLVCLYSIQCERLSSMQGTRAQQVHFESCLTSLCSSPRAT